MFERILIPLDGSPRAEIILGQVARILRRKDSELILLRVIDLPGRSPWEPARGLAYDYARGNERAKAQEYIHHLARCLADLGIRVHGQIAEGPAASTLLEQAELQGATLIAMTTHGRSGLSRWFLGSVAETVVRASSIPILLLRSFRPSPAGDLEPATAEELPFRKILVPTDGSPEASAVLAPAGEFARLFDAGVVVLHVEPPVLVPAQSELGMLSVLPPPPSEKDPVTEGPARRLEALGLRVSRSTVAGYPSGEILHQSRLEKVDLIAMATHGRSGFSRWVSGSVAEQVLRHSDVPLLLLRAEETSGYELTPERISGEATQLLWPAPSPSEC